MTTKSTEINMWICEFHLFSWILFSLTYMHVASDRSFVRQKIIKIVSGAPSGIN